MDLMVIEEDFSIPTRWGANDALGRILSIEASRPGLRSYGSGVWKIWFRVVSASQADIFIGIRSSTLALKSSIEISAPARLEVTGEGCTLTGSLHAESTWGVVFPVVWGALAAVQALLAVGLFLAGSLVGGLICLVPCGLFLAVAAGMLALYRLELRALVRNMMTRLRTCLDAPSPT